MTVSFAEVPSSSRVPFVFVEIDPSLAGVGPAIQEYRALVVGQRLAAGTVAQNVLTRATSADQVGEFFGRGSIVHAMAAAFFRNNRVTEAHFVGIDDAGGSVAATFTITVVGTATENGSLFLYIAGRQVVVPIVSGDVQNTIAASIAAALVASPLAAELPVTGGAAANVVTLTARNKGTQGNGIDVRLNHNFGEETPAGFTVAIAAGVAGATDPSTAGAIAAMGDLQFHTIAVGLNDSTAIGLWNTELAERFGPIEQKDGHAFFCKKDTHANLVTFGGTLNGRHTTVLGLKLPLSPTWEIAAAVVGIAAREAQADPARPFQTLELVGVLGSDPADRFTFTERDILLKNGVATVVTDELGVVRIERLITTNRLNSSGASSTAFLDCTTLFTLSFLRWNFRTQFVSSFPRVKLASDGAKFGAGQAVVTPGIVRAFALGVFRQWEERALVEGFDQFAADLIVERSSTDPNRIDIVLPPDLVNGLLVAGVSLRFLL